MKMEIKDIDIDGQRLHYEVSGPEDGRPVLLMHGWGCEAKTVRSIAALLSPAMRVYNVDLPGHGSSAEPSDVWGVGEFADLMEKFCDTLSLTDPVLIGHSFGGRVAILMSSRRPLTKMVLVDAAGIKPRRPLKYYVKVYSFKAMKRLAPLLLGKERGEALIQARRARSGSADYRAASPRMRAVMSRCVNQDLRYAMPSIKASTLLVWGANDTATPLSDARIMERLIPDAGLVSFDGCGHYSFLDNPGGFAAVMREFFKPELSAKH